jgi:hypothetical protein
LSIPPGILSIADYIFKFPIRDAVCARADLTCLSHDIPPQTLSHDVLGSGVRTICVYADRLVIGKRAAQPPFDDQSLVASQIAGPVNSVVRDSGEIPRCDENRRRNTANRSADFRRGDNMDVSNSACVVYETRTREG